MERRSGNAVSLSGVAMAADRQSTHVWHPPMAASGSALLFLADYRALTGFKPKWAGCGVKLFCHINNVL